MAGIPPFFMGRRENEAQALRAARLLLVVMSTVKNTQRVTIKPYHPRVLTACGFQHLCVPTSVDVNTYAFLRVLSRER